MNYKKDFPTIMESVIGGHYKLTKPSETFLNLLCFKFIEKIIKTSNNLLHPTDYESETIKPFSKKKLTNREIETSIRLLFPEEMVNYFLNYYNDSFKIFFSETVTEYLIKKSIVENIQITKKSTHFLTYITETLICDIFSNYEKIGKNKTITNKGLSKVFEEDKELKEILKVLKVSI